MAIGRSEDRDTPWNPLVLRHHCPVRDPIRVTHLGRRSSDRTTQAGHMTATDQRPSQLHILARRGPFSNRISVVNCILIASAAARGHGSLRGRKGPPQHLVRSAGAAMSTAGLRGVLRSPRPSVAVACTLAPSGNHPIRGNAWMDPGEGIVRRPPAARTSGMASPTATCYAESRRVFGQAPRAPCRHLIAWQSTGPSPSGLKPV